MMTVGTFLSFLAVLAGGVRAWQAAGFQLFSGVNVPSKAFGEIVEHQCATPRIGAAELKARLDAGEDIVVLDSRPMSEYRVMNIPGAQDCPGAELVYRVHEIVTRPETLVVVNCAGRTRSIIGAQSLINAGLENKVAALKNGTMGWHLSGLALEHGSTRHAPAPGPAALAKARAAATLRAASTEGSSLRRSAARPPTTSAPATARRGPTGWARRWVIVTSSSITACRATPRPST